MKIPFDVKYRPQIESGEYKVVTGDDRPVRIISWDKKVYGGRYEIVALVPTSQGDTEAVQLYCPDGTLIVSNWNEKFKLFIVTPEPELTEFETEVRCILRTYPVVPDKANSEAKRVAVQLLNLAKKELCKDCVLEKMDENRVYKHEGPTPPAYWSPCLYGGVCTDPSRKCFNCHRQPTIGINTASGTSNCKVEGKK